MGLGLSENADIALLFLSEPVLDVKPSYLPTPEEDGMMMTGDWVGVVGWGQQVATGQQESPPPGTYAIKQQGESLFLKLQPMSSKLVKSKTMYANVTETPVVLVLGKR